MDQELKEIVSLRFQIRDLNARLSSSQKNKKTKPFNYFKGVIGIMEQAKSLYEQKTKFLSLTEGVRKSFDFYATCQTMLENSDESLHDVLKISVKGAEGALTMKLDEYLKGFPIKEIENVQKMIIGIKGLDFQAEIDGEDFDEDQVLPRIEAMIKGLPNDELALASKVASNEIKHALDSLAGALTCISSIITSRNSLDVLNDINQNCVPDFETMTKTARQCLEQERYIKETQQLKNDSTLNMEHFENDLKILLLKIGNWFGELVQNYKINADIAKELNDNQFNLDVTNLETKIKTAAVVVEEDNFDDGLSDITEDVTFACEDD